MDDEKKYFQEDLKSRNDPIEQWPIKKLKKEASDDSGMGQAQERVYLGES